MNKKWLESIYDKMIIEKKDMNLNTYTNGFHRKSNNKDSGIINDKQNTSNTSHQRSQKNKRNDKLTKQTLKDKEKNINNKQKFINDIWEKLINYNLDESINNGTLEFKKNSKNKSKNNSCKKSSLVLKKNRQSQKNSAINEFKEAQEYQETNYTYLNETTNRKTKNNYQNFNDESALMNTSNNRNKKAKDLTSNIYYKANKYKNLYQESEKENKKLQKENEELHSKLRKTLDELDIMKEEVQLNEENKIENEKKIDELANFYKQNISNYEQKLYNFKTLLFKKDDEIKKLNKEIDILENKKKRIINEMEFKLSSKDKEIVKYKNLIKQLKENKRNNNFDINYDL